MKYYYVIFDHDCSSNAFSDNPYLFEQYIKERKDIIATLWNRYSNSIPEDGIKYQLGK